MCPCSLFRNDGPADPSPSAREAREPARRRGRARGRPSAEDARRLDDLEDLLQEKSGRFLGYPTNLRFDYRSLYRFLKYSINNVGDPEVPSSYQLNTKEFEREVLATFAWLTHARLGSVWGYVTNGGTEGNLHALFLARELHPDGVVFYSEDSHYSAPKAIHLLRLAAVRVRSHPDGRIDLDDLRRQLEGRRSCVPILWANVGTTMKGAVDDVPAMRRLTEELGFPRAYLHADAALSGLVLPFVDDAPPWDFRAGADSIAISGHKMIGSPIPCGVVLARREHVERLGQSIEYVATRDTTLPGSRNGITPLFLWHALRTLGRRGLRRRVRRGLALADYFIARLGERGRRAWRHPGSLTVVFDRPAAAIADAWQLAVQGDLAHVVTVPHVRREQLDRLVQALVADVPPSTRSVEAG
jgi:histidine decarboxylase